MAIYYKLNGTTCRLSNDLGEGYTEFIIGTTVLTDVTKIQVSWLDRVTLPADCTGMFRGWTNLTEIDAQYLTTSNVVTFDQFFAGCEKLKGVSFIGNDFTNVRSTQLMFSQCRNLTVVEFLDIGQPSAQFNAMNMFSDCVNLRNIYVNYWSNWVSKISPMSYNMYLECSNLKNIDKWPDPTSMYEGSYVGENGLFTLLDRVTLYTQADGIWRTVHNGLIKINGSWTWLRRGFYKRNGQWYEVDI